MNYLLNLHTSLGKCILLETICGRPFANLWSLWDLVWCCVPHPTSPPSHNSPHKVMENSGRCWETVTWGVCSVPRTEMGFGDKKRTMVMLKGFISYIWAFKDWDLRKLTRWLWLLFCHKNFLPHLRFAPFSCPFYLAHNWDYYSNSFNALTVNH